MALESAKKGSLWGRILIWAAVVAVIAFIGIRVSSTIATKPTSGQPPQPTASGISGRPGSNSTELTTVRVALVELRTVEELATLSGTLEPSYQVDVVSRRSGRIEQVNVKPGDRVLAGQILGAVEERDLLLQQRQMEANLVASQAGLRRAELQRDKAQSDYERIKKLYDQKAATELELKNAMNQVREADVQLEVSWAQLEQVKANADMLKMQLAQVGIDTPVDGVVLTSSLAIGTQVNTSTPVAKVAGIDPIEVAFYVPERDIGRLSLGQQFAIETDAFPGERFDGQVNALGTTVDPQTRSLEVRGEIPNPALKLRPGMFAKIELVIDKDEQIPAIPREALLTGAHGYFVYVVENDQVQQQLIEVGVQGREFVSATSGLAVGDVVVTVGQQGLRNGQTVRTVGGDK